MADEPDLREAAAATLDTLKAKPEPTPGDRLQAALAEIQRRGRAVSPEAHQAAATVQALAEYCQRLDPPVDLYEQVTGDRERDNTMLRALHVEMVGVQGSWTPADWWRLLNDLLQLGAIVLGLSRADGATALLQAARRIDAKAQPWW